MIPERIFVETLLQFLAPVRPYLEDPTVTEIMVNGPRSIYVERRGKLERVAASFGDDDQMLAALRNIAQYTGKEVDELHPILEGRLPDGSRVQAVIPPAAFGGPSLCIRRFSRSSFTMDRLIELGALSADGGTLLAAAVVAKLNIVVAGGTGSGKTSMLNTLSRDVPADERIIVIEDSKEVQLEQEHVVYMEARPGDSQARGRITIRDLFRATLRMRPDRIVIGEIRGGEALDIVQAMVSGHGGCMSTLHATHPRDTMTRLETMAMMSDVDMPLLAMRQQIGSGVDLIVQTARFPDGSRKVTHITEVLGYDITHTKYELADLFVCEFVGRDADERVRTTFLPTGVMPRFLPQLRQHGCDAPRGMYEAAARVTAP